MTLQRFNLLDSYNYEHSKDIVMETLYEIFQNEYDIDLLANPKHKFELKLTSKSKVTDLGETEAQNITGVISYESAKSDFKTQTLGRLSFSGQNDQQIIETFYDFYPQEFQMLKPIILESFNRVTQKSLNEKDSKTLYHTNITPHIHFYFQTMFKDYDVVYTFEQDGTIMIKLISLENVVAVIIMEYKEKEFADQKFYPIPMKDYEIVMNVLSLIDGQQPYQLNIPVFNRDSKFLQFTVGQIRDRFDFDNQIKNQKEFANALSEFLRKELSLLNITEIANPVDSLIEKRIERYQQKNGILEEYIRNQMKINRLVDTQYSNENDEDKTYKYEMTLTQKFYDSRETSQKVVDISGLIKEENFDEVHDMIISRPSKKMLFKIFSESQIHKRFFFCQEYTDDIFKSQMTRISSLTNLPLNERPYNAIFGKYILGYQGFYLDNTSFGTNYLLYSYIEQEKGNLVIQVQDQINKENELKIEIHKSDYNKVQIKELMQFQFEMVFNSLGHDLFRDQEEKLTRKQDLELIMKNIQVEEQKQNDEIFEKHLMYDQFILFQLQ